MKYNVSLTHVFKDGKIVHGYRPNLITGEEGKLRVTPLENFFTCLVTLHTYMREEYDGEYYELPKVGW